MKKILALIDEAFRKHIKIFMLFYFALCCTLIIISGPKIKRAVDIEEQEVFSNEEYLEKKLDSLYPSAESLVGYSVHCSLTEGSTKEIDIGFPSEGENIQSERLYDEDVIVTAGRNDCISFEMSENKKFITIKGFQPGNAVLYIKSNKYKTSYKIFVRVNE